MTKTKMTIAGLVFIATGMIGAPAFADGEYFQLDVSPNSGTAVGSVERGRIGAAVGLSKFEGGRSISANTTYKFDLPTIGQGSVIRVGPTVRLDQDDEIDFGAKVAFEQFTSTNFGGVFLLADYNTIASEYLLLAEVSENRYGFSTSFAIQGDDADFRENTLIIGYDVPNSPLRARVGYKFEAEEAVVGFSINTF